MARKEQREKKLNKHPIDCHYCSAKCEAGEAEIWGYKGRWYGACAGCVQENPKQVAGRKKMQENQRKRAQKDAETAPTEAQLRKMSKAQLVELAAKNGAGA